MNWFMEKEEGSQRMSAENGEQLLEAYVVQGGDGRWTASVLLLAGRRPYKRADKRSLRRIHGKAALHEYQRFDTKSEAVKWTEGIWAREVAALYEH